MARAHEATEQGGMPGGRSFDPYITGVAIPDIIIPLGTVLWDSMAPAWRPDGMARRSMVNPKTQQVVFTSRKHDDVQFYAWQYILQDTTSRPWKIGQGLIMDEILYK